MKTMYDLAKITQYLKKRMMDNFTGTWIHHDTRGHNVIGHEETGDGYGGKQ